MLSQIMTRSAFISAAALFASAALMPLTALAGPTKTAAAPALKPAAKPASKVVLEHPIATIVTVKGTIKAKLYPEEAPNTVANFISLVRKGFYNGLNFHRVDPGFVIQGGSLDGKGFGGPGYTIADEKNKTLRHNRGALAMAKTSAPDSANSQFYIVIDKPAPHLDGGYTVFGQVISGQDVAEKIQVGDKITKITISGAKTPYTPVKTIPAH